MNYLLKLFDLPLLKFSVVEDLATPVLEILWINEENRNLLPLDMEPTSEGLAKWVCRRAIPKNRAFVHSLLAKCNLNLNRPMSIISICKGLSLNDSYWVVEDGFDGVYDDFNLYDNRFSRILGLIAFSGYGSSVRSSLDSSPEFTTNGMLPKCWRRIDGQIKLYKGGTSGASNAGNEPYSEFYAAQVAEAMGIDAVKYGLSRWKGLLCSTCDLFTDKDHAYMPVGRLVTKGGMSAVFEYYNALGANYVEALCDMLVFDAVICNTDRHYGNFGFLVHSGTNKIVQPAPLFDHGNALFNFAGKEFMKDSSTLQQYADTLVPCVYDDFIGTARKHMTARNHEQVRRLLTFKFKKHARYNLPAEWLMLIEDQIRKRAQLLLK